MFRVGLILVLLTLLSSRSAFAATAAEQLDPAQSTLQVNPEDKEKPLTRQTNKNNYSVGVSHNGGFYEDTEQTSSLFGSLTRTLHKKLTGSIAQSFNQRYRTNPRSSDTGFSPNDTVLSISQGLYEDYLATSWSGKLSTTLPISERSQRLDLITTTTASASAIKSFMEKKVSVGVTPLARYYFSEYTTTPSDPGSGGGNPLPEYLLGITFSVTYKPHPKWSFSGSTGWTTQYFYKNRYENVDPIYGFTAPPRNSYNNSLSVSHDIDKNWGASLTYSHGDRYEKPWGTEYLLFNDRVTTWSAGVNYAFK